MQTPQRLFVLAVAAIWTVGFLSSTARALPTWGSGCSGCHSNAGGGVSVLPSSLIDITAGANSQITFDVTSVPVPKAALAVTGLDAAGLGATVGAGWTDGGGYFYSPMFTSTGQHPLDLAIDAAATTGDYGIGLVLAGGSSNWSTSQNFTLRISAASAPSNDQIAVHRSNQFYVDTNANQTWDGAGGGDDLFSFGTAGDVPIAGDWNGDGADELGIHRGSRFYLDGNGNGGWNGVSGGDTLFSFGAIGDVSVVGDWNGDGTDDIGVRRAEKFFLDANGDGVWNGTLGGDVMFGFGAIGDAPFAGDWNGDGTDEVGVLRDGRFFLDVNGNGAWNGAAGGDDVFSFGTAGDTPLVGDWNNDGTDDIGVHRADRFYLDANGDHAWNNVAGGDVFFKYGAAGDVAVVGNWNGSVVPLTATLVAIPEPATAVLALLGLCGLLSLRRY